jgi:type II secretory pathway predicted ATPase ExeA
MIEKHFNFTYMPFMRDVHDKAIYTTPVTKNLFAKLTLGVDQRLCVAITGDSGVGKTVAMRQFIDGLDKVNTLTLYVSESRLTPRNFYSDLLYKLGIKSRHYHGDAKRQLVKEITALHATGKTPVIVIDEAHLCGMDMLTEIRFLLNFKMDSCSHITLFLVGQTELRTTLSLQTYEAISQRIDLRCHIPALDFDQSKEYIEKQINCALDKPAKIFMESALKAIFDYSKGLPRKINKVASLCLIYAASNEIKSIDDSIVSLIIKGELTW